MALIPQHFSYSVVAIGNAVSGGETQWIGTAFFFGRPVDGTGQRVSEHAPDDPHKYYQTFLVTNRHVYEALSAPVIRANPAGSVPATEWPLGLTTPDGTPAWSVHPDPDVDVAVTGITLDPLRSLGYEVEFVPSGHALTVAEMTAGGFSEGDGMFLMGFPMGLVGVARSAAVVRGATLAQFAQIREGFTKYMLVDGYVFPGNSGGPAFSRPEPTAIQGTSAHPSAFLVGIVAAYLPYVDVAVSTQTQKPRVTFEENSGLSMVFPVDAIEFAADVWQAAHPAPPPSDTTLSPDQAVPQPMVALDLEPAPEQTP